MAVSISGDRSLKWVSELDAQKFYDELRKMNAQISQTSQKVVNEAGSMDASFNKLGRTLGTVFTVAALQQFGSQIIRVRGEFEQLEVAFTTMLGSKEKADKLMKDLVKFAGTTPFGLKDTSNAAKQLLAYGSDAKNITEELRTLGDVAAGVGAPIGDLVYLYGTLRTQGTAMLTDIRQFAGRGIPIYRELATVLNVSEKEVNGLVSAGKVGFKEVEQAFKNMTAAGSQFGGLMEAQSQTIVGQFERLGDAIDNVFNEIGQNNEGIIKKGIEVTASLIENYDRVFEVLGEIVIMYGSYKAAVMLNSLLVARQTALTKGWTAAELFQLNILKIKEAAMLRLNAVMAAMPVVALTAALAALATVAYSLWQYSDGAAMAQESLNNAQNEGQQAADKERRQIESLIGVIKSQTATKEEQKKAYDKLIASTGGYLDGYTQEQIALGKAGTALDQYIAKIRQAEVARKSLSEYSELAGQLDELNSKGIEAIGTFDIIAQGFKNIVAPTSQGIGMKQWASSLIDPKAQADQIVKQRKQAIEQAMKVLKEKHDKDWNAIIAGTDEDTGGNKNAGNAPLSKELINQRKKVLEEVAAVGYDLHLQTLSQDEKEIASIKKKYQTLRDEAKKAGLSSGVIERINMFEKQETGTLTYEQDTDKLKAELAKKKEAYAAYEQFATAVTKAEAQNRYGMLLGEQDTFAEVIDAEVDRMYKLLAERNKAGEQLSRAEQERLEMLKGIQKEVRDAGSASDNKAFSEAYAAYKTYEQQVLDIKAKFDKDRKALGEKASAGQLNLIREAEAAELAAINQAAYEKTAAYRALNERLVVYSKQQLKTRLQSLKDILNGGDAGTQLTGEINAAIQAAENALKGTNIDGTLTQLTRRASQLKATIYDPNIPENEKRKYIEELTQLNEEIKLVMQDRFYNIAGILNEVSGAFADISEAAGGADTGLGATLGTISEIAAVGANAAGSVASFMSGDIVGGITKGIKAIAGVVKIFKAAKESARKAREEVEGYYAKMAENELAYAQQLRERVRTQQEVNDLTSKELQLRQQMLATQQSQAQSDYDKLLARIQASGQQVTGMKTEQYGGFLGIGKKTRTVETIANTTGYTYDQLEKLFQEGKLTAETEKLFKLLQSSKEELDAIADKEKELADYVNERMTGGLTEQSITDTIINGFKAGKRGVDDFADDIEEQVKNAMLSAMAFEALQEPVRELMKQFTADAKDGLSKEEIDRFKNAYGGIISTGVNALGEIEKITGASFDALAGQTQGIAGQIQRTITESTANELSGLMRAQYEISRRNLDANLNGVTHLQAIERNTAMTVTLIDFALVELRAIAKQTKPEQTNRDLKIGG